MAKFMIMLFECSFTMSVLALIYMAVTPLLARRYSITGRYYSWLVIVIGMIIPIRPQSGNAVEKVTMPSARAVPGMQTAKGSAVTLPVPVKDALSSPLPDISWLHIMAAVWLSGMILFLVFHIIRHCRFLKLAARWSEKIRERQTLAILQSLKAQMGLSGHIGLKVCASIGSPMMTGFAKPCILLPNKDFSKEELHFILKHELIHYKRKDLWYKCLVLTAAAVHWFNPIVYLIAKAVDIQCELSCDAGVVGSMGPDTCLYYSKTILSTVRYQSKLKTALSTNFYGGKKGMKERILSIMDMNKKKTGLAVFYGILILTLGTGFAFAAKTETQDPPELIQENIKEGFSFAYSFKPDPQIYSRYSSYGIDISDDGDRLLYNGQRVRLFVDEHGEPQAFFLDEKGMLDLSVIRNEDSNITSIKPISRDKAQEYCSAFFADDIKAGEHTQYIQDSKNAEDITNSIDTAGGNKYEQYAPFGIELSEDGHVLNYKGQHVKLLADMLADGSFETYWTDDDGTANLSVVRNETGQITAIESISEEQAREYYSALVEYEQNILDSVDDKIAEKMKQFYPEE